MWDQSGKNIPRYDTVNMVKVYLTPQYNHFSAQSRDYQVAYIALQYRFTNFNNNLFFFAFRSRLEAANSNK